MMANEDVCEFCGVAIIGTMIGCGDGSGQAFMHRECYDVSRETRDGNILDAEIIE